MTEGLLKNTSLTAIAVAAGMVLGLGGAFAADLGGNCCADLEERVAELEATVAKKGTRKTSLEIWGDVNKVIAVWDDSHDRNAVIGSDNVNYSTRFGLRGMGKITNEVSSGYSIVIEWATGGRSTNISQFQDKSAGSGIGSGGSGPTTFTTNDPGITMREANWWIESSRLGRLTLGRFIGLAGVSGQVDLAGIGNTAGSGSASLIGTGLTFRTNQPGVGTAARGTGNYTNYTLGNTTDDAGEYGSRQNGIMYSTPTMAGFSFAASLAGATDSPCLATDVNGNCSGQNYGPIWMVNGKYANEFNGFRIAGAIGYEDSDNYNTTSMIATDPISPPGASRPHATNWGLSLSGLHVPTGLFAQGFYNEYKRGHNLFDGEGNVSVYAAQGTTSDTAKQWMIQAGIVRNWFGLGNTALYGEYQQTKNGFNALGLEGVGNTLVSGVSTSGGVMPNAYFGDVTTNKMWGLGVVQNIDAAALELYAGYRDFSLTSDNCTAAGGCKDIGLFVTGARIRF